MNKEQRQKRNTKIKALREKFWSYEEISFVVGISAREVQNIVYNFFPNLKFWPKIKIEENKIDRKIADLNRNN